MYGVGSPERGRGTGPVRKGKRGAVVGHPRLRTRRCVRKDHPPHPPRRMSYPSSVPHAPSFSSGVHTLPLPRVSPKPGARPGYLGPGPVSVGYPPKLPFKNPFRTSPSLTLEKVRTLTEMGRPTPPPPGSDLPSQLSVGPLHPSYAKSNHGGGPTLVSPTSLLQHRFLCPTFTDTTDKSTLSPVPVLSVLTLNRSRGTIQGLDPFDFDLGTSFSSVRQTSQISKGGRRSGIRT